MYRVSGVTKQYQQGKRVVQALRDVDLTIERGEMVVVQGPTGGGKSTLLQLLGGLDRATSGTIEMGEQDLGKLGERRLSRVRAEEIGFIFQTFNLIPTLNALENVESALVPLGVSTAERRARAIEALKAVSLGDRGTHLPSQLSGGQQQRVAIARALVKEPTVVLADEPTGNLDETTREEIMTLLEGLWRERGLTLIIVTHDSAVARRAKRHLWIKDGTVADRRGTPTDVTTG